jgi:hypothetical protein
MRVKIIDDNGPLAAHVDPDFHVPKGLRTPPDTPLEEIARAQEAVADYDRTHYVRLARRQDYERRHRRYHGGDGD